MGWGLLVEEFRLHRLHRRNGLVNGVDEPGLTGLIENAKSKSELAGIEYVLAYPSVMMDEIEMEITGLREQIQIEHEMEQED